MKYGARQWYNDITVNIHCDVRMGRWHCQDKQWVGDIARVQGGASVQLYHKALTLESQL